MLFTLISETQASSGIGVANVNITNRTVQNVQLFRPCRSGVKFALNGQLSTINAIGGFNPVSGEWLVTGSAAGFWVQRTIISGTLEVDAGAGFLQLNADRIYQNIKASSGSKTTVVFFEFSSDSGGATIVATATYTLISEQGFEFGSQFF